MSFSSASPQTFASASPAVPPSLIEIGGGTRYTMTIDDRLEKLTERHEALTQTVELLARNMDRLEETVTVTWRAILDLMTIVRSHETRINRLDDTVG